jgi:hypothetical protein
VRVCVISIYLFMVTNICFTSLPGEHPVNGLPTVSNYKYGCMNADISNNKTAP